MKEPSEDLDADRSARQRILEAAVAMIEEGGEAAVRISTVASRAGVTQGMISYYFGGREGLIEQAQLQRFSSTVTNDHKVLETMAREITSPEELRQQLYGLTRDIVDPKRGPSRSIRLMTIAAALPRPELLRVISEAQSKLTDDLEKIVLIGQARDLIRKDLDPRSLALFIMSYTIGLVVADIDHQRPRDEALSKVIDAFVDAILMPTS